MQLFAIGAQIVYYQPMKTAGIQIRNIPACGIAAALVAIWHCGLASDGESKHLGLNPKAEGAYRNAVELARHRDTLHAAVKPIEEAVRLEPNNARYWCEQANILHDLEDDEVAIASIKKSLELDNKQAAAWRIDSFILSALKDQPAALLAAENAIKLGGGLDADIQKASVLINMSRFSEAVQELDKVLKHEPQNTVARERRMIAAERLRDYKLYLSDCDYFLGLKKLQPLDAKMLVRRAKAYTHLKQYDKAISDYNTALKFMPDMRQAHAGLLEVYRTTGDTRHAAIEATFLKNLDKDLSL